MSSVPTEIVHACSSVSSGKRSTVLNQRHSNSFYSRDCDVTVYDFHVFLLCSLAEQFSEPILIILFLVNSRPGFCLFCFVCLFVSFFLAIPVWRTGPKSLSCQGWVTSTNGTNLVTMETTTHADPSLWNSQDTLQSILSHLAASMPVRIRRTLIWL